MPNIYTLYSNGTFEAPASAALVLRKGNQATTIGLGTVSNEAAFAGTQSLKIETTLGLIGGFTTETQRAWLLPKLRVDSGQGPNVIPLVPGKKYRAKCMVMTPSATPIAGNGAMILFGRFIGIQTGSITITDVSSNRKQFEYTGSPSFEFRSMIGAYVADMLDTWLEIEYEFIHSAS